MRVLVACDAMIAVQVDPEDQEEDQEVPEVQVGLEDLGEADHQEGLGGPGVPEDPEEVHHESYGENCHEMNGTNLQTFGNPEVLC